jgi:hypothetical protein
LPRTPLAARHTLSLAALRTTRRLSFRRPGLLTVRACGARPWASSRAALFQVALASPATLWVKRTDVVGARYVALRDVDLALTVDELATRWMTLAKLGMDPSLVTLKLVKCGAGKPTSAQEEAAALLDDPSVKLAEAQVTGTAWLLAVVAGACPRSATRICSHLRARRSTWGRPDARTRT